MPLDGGYRSIEEINRRLLIDELKRDQPDFLWESLDRCAMGIACRMGISSNPLTHDVGPAVGLSREDAYRIFMTHSPRDEWVERSWLALPWWRKLFASKRTYGRYVVPIHIAEALERAPYIVTH